MSYIQRQKLKLRKGRTKEFYKINVIRFIEENFNSNQVWLPELVVKIFNKFHFNVNDIKNMILQVFKEKSKIFKVDYISSDLIKYWERRFYPEHNNNYINYLIINRNI